MIRIKNINKLLKKIDVFSTTLGGAKFVSSSIVLPVVKSIRKILQPDDEDPSYISEMKRNILDDFKVRCSDNINGSSLLKVTALDPRLKNL